jgi:hypothetical protein
MWGLESKYTTTQYFTDLIGHTIWKQSNIFHNSYDREKTLCFIKMQHGGHISYAWIMYDLQCYLLDCLITNIFQNVSMNFSSLRTNMYLYKNITNLWTHRIIFCQISMHTSNWHRYNNCPTFLKNKNMEKKYGRITSTFDIHLNLNIQTKSAF